MRLDCSFLVVQVDHLEGCVLSHLNIWCTSTFSITAFKHICTTSATSLTVILLMHSWRGYWFHHQRWKQTARSRVRFQRFDVVSGGRKSIVAILFHEVSCASLLRIGLPPFGFGQPERFHCTFRRLYCSCSRQQPPVLIVSHLVDLRLRTICQVFGGVA